MTLQIGATFPRGFPTSAAIEVVSDTIDGTTYYNKTYQCNTSQLLLPNKSAFILSDSHEISVLGVYLTAGGHNIWRKKSARRETRVMHSWEAVESPVRGPSLAGFLYRLGPHRQSDSEHGDSRGRTSQHQTCLTMRVINPGVEWLYALPKPNKPGERQNTEKLPQFSERHRWHQVWILF